MDFSVVIIPTPFLATAGVAALLLAILLTIANWFYWHRRYLRPMYGAQGSALRITNESIMLIGPEYDWISNLSTTFACPQCHQIERLDLRLFRYIDDDSMIGLFRHNCSNLAIMGDTIEVPGVKRA